MMVPYKMQSSSSSAVAPSRTAAGRSTSRATTVKITPSTAVAHTSMENSSLARFFVAGAQRHSNQSAAAGAQHKADAAKCL